MLVHLNEQVVAWLVLTGEAIMEVHKGVVTLRVFVQSIETISGEGRKGVSGGWGGEGASVGWGGEGASGGWGGEGASGGWEGRVLVEGGKERC